MLHNQDYRLSTFRLYRHRRYLGNIIQIYLIKGREKHKHFTCIAWTHPIRSIKSTCSDAWRTLHIGSSCACLTCIITSHTHFIRIKVVIAQACTTLCSITIRITSRNQTIHARIEINDLTACTCIQFTYRNRWWWWRCSHQGIFTIIYDNILNLTWEERIRLEITSVD